MISPGSGMSERTEVERLLRELHAARVAGQLDALCALFSPDARFRIAGTSEGKPVAIDAAGSAEIRPWLSMLVKTFRIANYQLLSSVIDGGRAAVHWRADIHSRITGSRVATELVDLVETRADRIASYVEFFHPVKS
jgi:ketosteroid isomerase-like protein